MTQYRKLAEAALESLKDFDGLTEDWDGRSHEERKADYDALEPDAPYMRGYAKERSRQNKRDFEFDSGLLARMATRKYHGDAASRELRRLGYSPEYTDAGTYASEWSPGRPKATLDARRDAEDDAEDTEQMVPEDRYDTDYGASQSPFVASVNDILSPQEQDDLLAQAWASFKKHPELQDSLLRGERGAADRFLSELWGKVMGMKPMRHELEAVAPLILRRLKRKAETGKDVFAADRHF